MTFTDGTKDVTFKRPYKDPERSELSSDGNDLLSSRVILSEDDYDRGCRRPSDLEDGFYRDTIKLEPEYATRTDDEREVTSGVVLLRNVGKWYCCEDAKFSVKEVDVGITADLGSLQRHPELWRIGMRKELALTWKCLSAVDAGKDGA
ncbi:protein kinase-like domain, concanavalin A-like lectin/glucanase domain protein [Tanacetum coccineum]